MHTFSTLQGTPPDPILQANAEARAAGPDALNATVGVLMNEHREPVVFPSVAAAIAEVGSGPWALGYPPPIGTDAFRGRVRELFFGGRDGVAVAATTGGSAAIRAQLELLKRLREDKRSPWTVLTTGPAWPVYERIFSEAGVPLKVVGEAGTSPVPALLEELRTGAYVPLLQAGGQNPTGKDPSPEEWRSIAAEAGHAGVPVLLDMAYQGLFGQVDDSPVNALHAAGVDVMAAVSFSKNHTIYGLRTGAAALLAAGSDKRAIESQYEAINGGMGTAPVPVGQWIVDAVQSRHAEQWKNDLRQARDGLDTKRQRIADRLSPALADAMKGRGMFALLPLSPTAIAHLRTKHKTFLPPDGRLNISAVPFRMIDNVCAQLNEAAGEAS